MPLLADQISDQDILHCTTRIQLEYVRAMKADTQIKFNPAVLAYHNHPQHYSA